MSLSLNASITLTKDVVAESCLSTKLLCGLAKFTSIIGIIHETNDSYMLQHQTLLKFLLIIEFQMYTAAIYKKITPLLFVSYFAQFKKMKGLRLFDHPVY